MTSTHRPHELPTEDPTRLPDGASFDASGPPVDDDDDLPVVSALADAGAVEVLRRGLAVSPELKTGIAFTALMALATAAGKIAVPILIQQALDRGVLAPDGFDGRFVTTACVATVLLVLVLYNVSRLTYRRLVRAAENTLYGLRVRVFAHIHALAIADHEDTRRGVLVSRVTSDIETLARFAEWGAVAWMVNGTVIVGVLVVMFVYSWPLALITTAIFAPLTIALRALQRRQLAAYDLVRTRVSETLSEFSETIGGAGVIRAYGLDGRARRRLDDVIDRQYRSEVRAARYFAVMFPLGDLFGAVALAAVAAVGAWYGPGWGLGAGELIAFLFLVSLVLTPIAEIGEVLDQTQTAIAGWRKVLSVLDVPIDVEERRPGVDLPSGPLAVTVEEVEFSYRRGGPVLRDIAVDIPAGTSVAVVGETGSGKTTFAKLLCRLADPTVGRVRVGGIDLRDVDPEARLRAVRLVPQDGFLFDATLRENLRVGRLDASDDDLDAAVAALGLGWWVD
nr:ABC transporter ATP-binding protein [Acidimicrobiia bacterium]